MKTALVAGFGWMMGGIGSAAVTVVDADSSAVNTKRATVSFGQTFTPSLDGSLSAIRLNVASGTSFSVTVWSLDSSGTALGSVLGKQAFQISGRLPSYSWVEVGFGGGIHQTAGVPLAFTVSANQGFLPGIAESGAYVQGSFFEFGGAKDPIAANSLDLGFQTLVVPVPEPAAAMLAVIGAAGGFWRRKRPREA